MSDITDESMRAVLDQAAQTLASTPGTSAASGAAQAPRPLQAAAGDLAAFLRGYYRHAPAEDLARYGPDPAAAVAAQHAALAAHRPQGRPLVQVREVTDDGPGPSSGFSGQSGDHGPGPAALGPVRTVIDIVTDDMPYLVDSVTTELNRHQADISLFLHPRLVARRDVAGRLRGVLGVVED